MEKQIKLDEKSAQEFVSAASRCNFQICGRLRNMNKEKR